ncbi:MAG: DUF5067 domain-containing protein [Tannerella sp.]|jgi:hypothetical protein|nr:DUF5067 domain-containing protein [Tannerella sp.]
MNNKQTTKKEEPLHKQSRFWMVIAICKIKFWIVSGAVLIGIYGIIGETGISTSHTSKSKTPSAESDAGKSKNKVDLMINRAEEYSNYSSYIQPDRGKKFVKVIFTITNNNKKSIFGNPTVGNLDFSLVVNGEKINALMILLDDADKAANPDYLSNTLEFPTGAAYTKSLLFEVPVNATTGTLKYGLYSTEAEAKANFPISVNEKNATTTGTRPRETSRAETGAGKSKNKVDLIINRAGEYSNYSSIIQPDPGKKFVKVIFTITNNGEKSIFGDPTVGSLEFSLVINGEKINAVMMLFDDADKAANPDYLSNTLEFPIGAAYTKSLLFEVPVNATAGTLKYGLYLTEAEAKVNF